MITTTFSAHPTVDQHTGELINIGVLARHGGQAPEIRYDVIDSAGNPTKTEYIPIPHQTMMHTFFVTENFVVFPVTPLDVSVQRAISVARWWPGTPSGPPSWASCRATAARPTSGGSRPSRGT
ncbi:hypothetical protein MCHIJ_00090 [Mycolicibacterium chitae]|nr:hypothetical protein MCHIJ_00090 [Mycolicibacterium chitae]